MINDFKKILIDYRRINDDGETAVNTCNNDAADDLIIRLTELQMRIESLNTRIQSANAATTTILQQSLSALEIEIARSLVLAERTETECS